mgnify:FL=1
MKLKKLKGVIEKMLKEVISEQGVQDIGTPTIYDLGNSMQIACPPGFKFKDNLPSGNSSPSVSQQMIITSKCVPITAIDADDIPTGPFGKPGTEGGKLKPKPKSGIQVPIPPEGGGGPKGGGTNFDTRIQ